MRLNKGRNYFIAALSALLLAAFISVAWPRVTKARREAQVMSQAHFLTKCLEIYVSDFGDFPESLEVMLAKQKIDNEVLDLGKREALEYYRPKTNDPNSVLVLVIRADGYRIAITKDFERRKSPLLTN
jgi:type II secretory pathway pseudopilin PulG